MCIISSVSIVEAPVGLARESFSLIFSLTKGIIKNINVEMKQETRNEKKKYNKILMVAKSKLNSIETLLYQVSIEMEISHEEFITILKEKDKYEKMKGNVRNVSESEKQKKMRLNRVNSRS